jgi:hypothetical protein
VAVDGRTLYQDDSSFDRPRWLGISLAATGRAATGAQLLDGMEDRRLAREA